MLPIVGTNLEDTQLSIDFNGYLSEVISILI